MFISSERCLFLFFYTDLFEFMSWLYQNYSRSLMAVKCILYIAKHEREKKTFCACSSDMENCADLDTGFR